MIELRWGVSELIAQRRFWLLLAAVIVAGVLVFIFAGGGSGDEIDSLRESANIPALAEIVKSAPPEKARRALWAISQVGGPEAAKPLHEATQAPDWKVREVAVLTLPIVTRRKHIDELADLLKNDPAPQVRAAAATALGQVYACKKVPELVDSLSDKDPLVQQQAKWAVVRICGVEPGYESPAEAAKHQQKYYTSYWNIYGKTITRYHEVHNKR
ncbi:MAG: HEAT repeat domain-containing protein [Planctomycetaceae bacterium]|nr:HEAT repeat domain-containing protein [Planctomycetaceae bacterium]